MLNTVRVLEGYFGPIWLFKTWAVLALTGAKTAPLKGTVLGSKLLCPDGEGLDAGVLRL